MSFWKVMTGVAVGVAAVAAAPITGGGSVLAAGVSLSASLAGTGAVAAGVAGVAGGAAAMAMDDSDDIRQEGYNKGQKEAKAKAEIEMKAKIENVTKNFKDVESYFNYLIALEAVGLAVANCDGEICESELVDIRQFVAGAAESGLPEALKEKMKNMIENPPNINEAWELAKKANVEMSVFDDVIQVAMHSDNHIHEKETEFLQAWESLKSAA